MELRKYLDPDSQLIGKDKLLHGLGGAVIAFGCLVLGLGWLLALLIVFVAGVSFEAGQLDTAWNPDIYLKRIELGRVNYTSPLGEVGFGFGLLDLAWDMLGAGVLIILYTILF